MPKFHYEAPAAIAEQITDQRLESHLAAAEEGAFQRKGGRKTSELKRGSHLG